MKTIKIEDAQTELLRLVDEAIAGEEICLAKDGKPAVRLIPLEMPRNPRQGGQLSGRIKEEPGCWEGDDLSRWI